MTLVWHRVPGSIPADASGTTSKTDGLPKDSKERPGEGEAQHADVGSLTLSEDVSRSREHRAGSTVRGRFLDSRGRFAHFDGRRLHSTEAFEGEPDRSDVERFWASRGGRLSCRPTSRQGWSSTR